MSESKYIYIPKCMHCQFLEIGIKHSEEVYRKCNNKKVRITEFAKFRRQLDHNCKYYERDKAIKLRLAKSKH